MDLSTISNQISRHGYARLPQLLTQQEADQYRKYIHELRVAMNDSFSPKESGRITYVHTRVPQTLDILLSDRLTDILKTLLNDKPVLCQAAVYRLGSEYSDHFDRYFYPTNDSAKELTVWIALEDVHPDSGPFYVIPGSHHWPDANSESLKDIYPEWQKSVETLCDANAPLSSVRDAVSAGIDLMSARFTRIIAEKKSQRVPLLLKKGDAVVWRSNLVHGGFKRINNSITRECLVGNYIAQGSKLWSTKQFFQFKPDEFSYENARKVNLIPFKDAHYLIDGEAKLG